MYVVTISGLIEVFKAAKLMRLNRLMIFTNATHVEKNKEKIPKWQGKGWRHGTTKGKGKMIANFEEWMKIAEFLEQFEIQWVFNPNTPSFLQVLQKATSQALLVAGRESEDDDDE